MSSEQAWRGAAGEVGGRGLALLGVWHLLLCGPVGRTHLKRRKWQSRPPNSGARAALRHACRAISCGAEHTIAITPQDVITWGSNEHGQCGHGEKAEIDWVKPRSIKVRGWLSGEGARGRAAALRRGSLAAPGRAPRRGAAVAQQQACALLDACTLLTSAPLAPRMQMLHEQMVTQVVCGRFHTLCVTATSQVFAWGLNSSGQLGLGDTLDRRAPAALDALWAMPVLQIAAGGPLGRGPGVGKGRRRGGQGARSAGCAAVPSAHCTCSAGAGEAHSAALTSNGFMFTWGGNDKGQLGLPAAADVAQQMQVGGIVSARPRLAAGGVHSVCLHAAACATVGGALQCKWCVLARLASADAAHRL